MLESKYETYDLSLRIFTWKDQERIYINFTGKSKSKEPGDFIGNIFKDAFQAAVDEKKGITLNFGKLEYMNSATVSPIIKIWAKLKSAGIPLTVIYDEEIPWQKTSFSAFSVFEKESNLFKLSGKDI